MAEDWYQVTNKRAVWPSNPPATYCWYRVEMHPGGWAKSEVQASQLHLVSWGRHVPCCSLLGVPSMQKTQGSTDLLFKHQRKPKKFKAHQSIGTTNIFFAVTWSNNWYSKFSFSFRCLNWTLHEQSALTCTSCVLGTQLVQVRSPIAHFTVTTFIF